MNRVNRKKSRVLNEEPWVLPIQQGDAVAFVSFYESHRRTMQSYDIGQLPDKLNRDGDTNGYRYIIRC